MLELTDDQRSEWIETYEGVNFTPLDPDPLDVRIGDIAHALSNKCRYTGHSEFFFSVAEHSVLIAEYIERQWADDRYAMIALLHDAAEAYLPDVSTPLKRAWPWWENIEARVRRAVFDALGVPGFHIPASIKYLDDRIKLTEARVLMTSKGEAWVRYRNMEPLDVFIHGWTPNWAKSQFLAAYARIANKIRNRKRPPVTA